MRRSDTLFNAAVLTVYIAVVAFALDRHAMWRDEMQAWLIARDAAGIGDLLGNLHYEGHPALWYLLLMPLARISTDPRMMQGLHLAIAAGMVAVVLWRAPFSRLERALFAFGYFPLFEYAVKSRSYGLGTLIVAIVCALWPQRRQRPIAIAVALALMANVHVVFTIISLGFIAAIAVERLLGDRAAPSRREIAALAIVALGWVLAAKTAVPPPDEAFDQAKWFFDVSLARASIVFNGLGAVLGTDYRGWCGLGGLAVLAVPLWRWRANRPAAALLAVSLGGLVVFFYTKYTGYVWHHGAFFVVLVAAVWIARVAPGPRALLPAPIFIVVLLVQAANGVQAVQEDLHRPYSEARAAARFIIAQGWDRGPIVAADDVTASTVAGYLGAERLYYSKGGRWGSFVKWDPARKVPVDDAAVLADTDRVGAKTLIEWREINPSLLAAHGFSEAARFVTPNPADEYYIIYHRP